MARTRVSTGRPWPTQAQEIARAGYDKLAAQAVYNARIRLKKATDQKRWRDATATEKEWWAAALTILEDLRERVKRRELDPLTLLKPWDQVRVRARAVTGEKAFGTAVLAFAKHLEEDPDTAWVDAPADDDADTSNVIEFRRAANGNG